jgi:hypothetical protein
MEIDRRPDQAKRRSGTNRHKERSIAEASSLRSWIQTIQLAGGSHEIAIEKYASRPQVGVQRVEYSAD